MKRMSTLSVRAAIAATLAAGMLLGAAVLWRTSQALKQAANEVQDEHEFRFTAQPYLPPANLGFETVSSPQVFLQAARFQDHIFIAGPAGLMEYDPSGTLLHQYSVGSDLPGSPLIAVASGLLTDSHEQELVIATAGQGILAFNGQSFRQILPASPDARAVTAILPVASGHLLFGTKKRGVLIYDGKQIGILHPRLDSVYVTSLAGDESDLWVGTLNRGVLHLHAGEVEAFAEADGLPDPQVQALATSDSATYVGTATGVAVFQSGRFSRVLAPGVLVTALFATARQLYVGSEDQGIIAIPLEGRRPNPTVGEEGQVAEVRQIFRSGDLVFAVARDGVYRMGRHGLGWERVLEPRNAALTDRNISALAANREGQLWVGYFDRGLDLLPASSTQTQHVEDEHVFCVNRIFPERKSNVIDVATANGLVRFNEAGSEQQILTRADGLIADHVTDIVDYRDGLALATPAGLTFLDAGGARSLYAFHGLVNNHVYTLGAWGDELMAGTLGGLSQLDRGDIKINYTTTTSGLKHNWITSVVRVGSEWMVGTYGAGVLGLDASGRFHPFDLATGPIEINPNAMLVTSDYVLAGSLGDGLYLYDRQSGRWSVVRDELPSLNVTAFTWLNGYIYIGTDNGLVRIPERKLHS